MKAFPYLSTSFFLVCLSLIAGNKSRVYPSPVDLERNPSAVDGITEAATVPLWASGETWLIVSRVCLALAFVCFLGWTQQRARARLERRIAQINAQAFKQSKMPPGRNHRSRRR